MESGQYCTGYVTAPTIEEARRLSTALVEKKLVACANILGPMESIYHWQGKVENSSEYLVLLKTTGSKQKAISLIVKSLHTYQTPCIVFHSIEGGDADYLEWIKQTVDSE